MTLTEFGFVFFLGFVAQAVLSIRRPTPWGTFVRREIVGNTGDTFMTVRHPHSRLFFLSQERVYHHGSEETHNDLWSEERSGEIPEPLQQDMLTRMNVAACARAIAPCTSEKS